MSLTFRGYLYNKVVEDAEALGRGKAFITEGLASGKLKPVIAKVFPFEQIVEATESLESHEQIGRIVVTV